MRAVVRTLALAVLMAALSTHGARAQAPSLAGGGASIGLEQQRIDAFWTTGPQQDWFAVRYLQVVRFAGIAPIPKRVEDALGAYRRTTGAGGRYVSQFASGTVDVRIHIDAAGKIDGFRLLPPVRTTGGIEGPVKQLGTLPGTVAYVLIVNHKQRAAQNADLGLASGPAAKVAILAALRTQIASGRRHWSDVVALQERWKSSPPGVLQSWPAGTPITIASYAAQMISIGDKTAANALSAILGAPAIALYTSRNGSLFTARELCALMDEVADLPLMSIDPALADPAKFAHVAFIGGSVPGVLTYVTGVTMKSGSHACLALTVNSARQAVDESAAGTAYRSVLNALAR